MQLNAAPFLDGIARVQTQMRNLQASVAGITGVFFAARAAFAGFAGILNQMRGTLDLGGTLSDLAASTGVAAGEMLVLQRAFQDNGLGAEEAGTMLNRMQRAIVEAGQGSATYAGAFNSLGLSLGQLRDLTPEQQLRTIGQAIASIKDPTESTAASMQIFGRAGGRLQTLFENFDGAVGDARTAVGSLADVMDGNADRFDFVSDAINGASQKLTQFFAGFLSETLDTEPFEDLNRLDLTGLGQSVGDITNQIAGMVGAFQKFLPVIAGVGAGMIALRSGFSASVLTGFSSGLSGIGTALAASSSRLAVVGAAARTVFGQMAADVRMASQQAQVGFTGMAASARGAAASIRAAFATTFRQLGLEARVAGSVVRSSFSGMVTAARAAGAGMKAALISTGIGAVIVGIGLAIEKVMGKISALNEAARAGRREGGDMSRNVEANNAAILNVASADEQSDLLETIDGQIASVRERLGSISDQYDSDEAIAAASEQLDRHIALLERQRQSVANISPQYMAQAAAVRAQEQALIASRQRAEELGKEVARAVQQYDKTADQRALDEMTPDAAEDKLLGRAGVVDLSALRAYIERQKESNDLKDYEKERLLEMISLEQQLVAVQQRQNQEREKAAQQAARLADLQADLVLEAEKAAAEASGDKDAVRAIEVKQREIQISKQLEGQGMNSEEAGALASKRAQLDQLSTELGQQREPTMVADAQRAIGLGGNIFAEQRKPQEEMVRRQADANRLLADIKNLLTKQGPRVLLAETFD